MILPMPTLGACQPTKLHEPVPYFETALKFRWQSFPLHGNRLQPLHEDWQQLQACTVESVSSRKNPLYSFIHEGVRRFQTGLQAFAGHEIVKMTAASCFCPDPASCNGKQALHHMLHMSVSTSRYKTIIIIDIIIIYIGMCVFHMDAWTAS